MTVDEFNEFISRCDFSNFKSDNKKRQKQVEQKLFPIDINKCRINIYITVNKSIPYLRLWINLKYMTKINNIAVGGFILNLNNTFLLHGNGRYSCPLINYCLDEQLINHNNINIF